MCKQNGRGRNMLLYGLKLCANGVDVVETCYDLFTNCMDGQDGFDREENLKTLSKFAIIWQLSSPAIKLSDNVVKTRWKYNERNCRSWIVLGSCYYVIESTCAYKPGPFSDIPNLTALLH